MNCNRITIATLSVLLAMAQMTGKPAVGAPVSGLIHYWSLDETSGFTAHDSIRGNDATLSGFAESQPTWVPGKIGGSLNFFTASNYVITSDPIPENQYTINFWLKVNGPAEINPRLIGPRDGNHSWVVISDEFQKGVGFYYDHGRNTIQDPNLPARGIWENYAVTIDLTHSAAAVYRNGRQVAAGAFADRVPLANWVFGHNQDPGNPIGTLNGQLDEIRIYNRILTPLEIAQLVPEPTSGSLGMCALMALMAFNTRRRSP